MPPVSGSAAAISARERAPHNVMAPPATHRPIITKGLGAWREIPAGDRKIPEPMVMPTTSATELHSPSVRGRRPSGTFIGPQAYHQTQTRRR